MASVTLTRVYVALKTDLANPVVGGSTSRADARDGGGEVRKYAGGRFRNVTRAGTSRQYDVTLRMLDWATVQLLDSWCEQTMLLRDTRGRKVWGTFHKISVTDYRDGTGHDVGFTFIEVTDSEAV